MTTAQRNYLLTEQPTTPNPGGYRAALSDSDPILRAPTGEIMAGFTSYEDAVFAAHCCNSVSKYEQAICGAMTVLAGEAFANTGADLRTIAERALAILESANANYVAIPGTANDKAAVADAINDTLRIEYQSKPFSFNANSEGDW